MKSLCEVKVSYIKSDAQAKVNEVYLVEAITMASAENGVIDYLKDCIFGDFNVQSIKKCRKMEFINKGDSSYWFKIKVNFIELDEKTGREKRKPYHYLVNAENVDDAHEKLKTNLHDCVLDWELVDIITTNIVDVILCENEQQQKNETNE